MNEVKTYKIKGMHCASCASIIERTVKKIDGVESIAVNNGTENAKISFDQNKTNPESFNQKLEPLGYSLIEMGPVRDREGSQRPSVSNGMGMSENEHAEHLGLNQSKQEKLDELAKMKNTVLITVPITIFSIIVMAWDLLGQTGGVGEMPLVWMEFFHHVLPVFATYMLLVVGKPYLLGVYRFLRYGKANMDTLVGIGTGAAFLYSLFVSAFEETIIAGYPDLLHSYYDVAIIVIAFITFGKYLETRSKIKTGDAIEKLLNLQAKTALVVRNGKEIELAVS